MTFDLTHYATLAEQRALELKAAKEKKAAMQKEAERLTAELNDALFEPYVGRKVRLHYNATSVLKRGVPDSLYKAVGLVPEEFHHSVDTHGWFAVVCWVDSQERMEASVRQAERTAMYGKELVLKGGDGDIGTQAVQLAKQFAELIAKRLVVE